MNNELYKGSTNDLRRRVEEHNSGESVSTKRYKPWRLVYYESFLEESLARSREHNLKHNGNAMRELKKRIGETPSRKHKSSAGFTLIEILVIVALFAFLMSIGALMGFDSITRSTVHNERDLVVLMLTGARTRALANINENAQGVRITASEIILFEGDAFDDSPSTHRSTARNSAITATLTPNVDIVFDQLSAAVANDINIELEDTSGKTADIDINGQGRIEW